MSNTIKSIQTNNFILSGQQRVHLRVNESKMFTNIGFTVIYVFLIYAAETVEEARCTFPRCLLLQSFQHPWIIQAIL